MTAPLRILLVEDVQSDVFLIEYELRKTDKQFLLRAVKDKEEFIKAFDDFKPEVILCDHILPSFNSVEALQIFNQLNLCIPFIIVSGQDDEQLILNIIREGADEYIVKSDLSRLPVAVEKVLNKKSKAKKREEVFEIAKNSEAKIQILLDALPDMILIVSKEGKFLDCKTGQHRELVHLHESITGRTLTEIFPPRLSKKVLQLVDKTISGNSIHSFEFISPASVELQDYKARLVPYQNDAVLMVVQNITEEKRQNLEKKKQRMSGLLL